MLGVWSPAEGDCRDRLYEQRSAQPCNIILSVLSSKPSFEIGVKHEMLRQSERTSYLFCLSLIAHGNVLSPLCGKDEFVFLLTIEVGMVSWWCFTP